MVFKLSRANALDTLAQWLSITLCPAASLVFSPPGKGGGVWVLFRFAGLSSHSMISGGKVVVDYMSTLSCNDLVIIVLFKLMISAQPRLVHYRKPLSKRSN